MWVSFAGLVVIAVVATALMELSAFVAARRVLAALTPEARRVYVEQREDDGRGLPRLGTSLGRGAFQYLILPLCLLALVLIGRVRPDPAPIELPTFEVEEIELPEIDVDELFPPTTPVLEVDLSELELDTSDVVIVPESVQPNADGT